MVETIKNAPETSKSINNQDTFSISKNLDKSNVLENMPETLSNTAMLLEKRLSNMSMACILNCLIVKTAQMITSKRVTFKTIENDTKNIIPNWYSIIFAPSGYGKDVLNNTLNDYLFKNFREKFKTLAEKEKSKKQNEIQQEALSKYPEDKKESLRNAYIKSETEKIRNLVLEMQDGTQEGFFSDAKAFSQSDFGSLFTIFSEFGNYLKSTNTEKEQFINCLFTAYDGKVTSKCIKGSNREADIENMPVNALMLSDYTYFKNDIKDVFNKWMSVGISRRSVLSFQSEITLKKNNLSYENNIVFINNANTLNQQIFDVYKNIKENSCYILEKSAYNNVYVKYDNYCIDEFNSCDDDLLKKEIKSRPFKALKLACLYAVFNHVAELKIKESDLIQAIYTIQYLSKDLKAFYDYKPVKKDSYDNIYKFFVDNLNKPVKLSDLKTKHYKNFWIFKT